MFVANTGPFANHATTVCMSVSHGYLFGSDSSVYDTNIVYVDENFFFLPTHGRNPETP